MNKILTTIVIALIYVSCGIPKTDYDNLIAENVSLKKEVERVTKELEGVYIELDQYKFGSDKTIALIKQYNSENNLILARDNIKTLAKYHPEDLEKQEVKNLISQIERKEREESLRIAAEQMERRRLANISNTGIWRVGHYVDSFGEPTKEGYITTKEYIKGTFSNTATQNSDLNVNFLITDSNDVDVQLYEYAGRNPVKAYSVDDYTVQIQDKDGNRNTLKATNGSDRLSFGREGSRIVHNALMKGGNVKFYIIEDNTPTTKYRFEISNADWYENAYRILKGQ